MSQKSNSVQQQRISELVHDLQELDQQALESVLKIYPEISLSQKRLWTMHQLDPNSNAYNIPILLRIEGDLDFLALQKTVAEIVSRHELLRSIFFPIKDSAKLLLLDDSTFHSFSVNISTDDWAQAEKSKAVLKFIEDSFDLTKQTGFRCELFKFGNSKFVLAMVFHHLVVDGWSLGIFFDEFKKLYSSFVTNSSALLEEVQQYSIFSKWEHSLKQQGELSRQSNFWKNLFQEDSPQSNLCRDGESSIVVPGLAENVDIPLPMHFSNMLRENSRNKGYSIFSILMSGFHALNYRLSRRERTVIGTTTFNRKMIAFEKIIGFFVNTLAIPSTINEQTTFAQLTQAIQNTIQGAYVNDSIPFDQVASTLQRDSRPDRKLFRVALEFQRSPYNSFKLDGLMTSWLEVSGRLAKFDLTMFFFESDEGFTLKVEFDSNAYSRAEAQQMGQNLVGLITSALDHPDIPIALIPFTSNSATLHGPEGQIPDTNLWDVFHSVAKIYPDRIALRSNEISLSYSEVYRFAINLAAQIQIKGIQNSFIGVVADRSTASLISILAIWASGNGYVPLDPKAPTGRITYIANDARLKLILKSKYSDFNFAEVLTASSEELMSLPSDEFESKITHCPYSIYTSGSTGVPKACIVNTNNVLNLMMALEENLKLNDKEPLRISLNAPIYFDASVQQIVMMLRGHTLCIVPEDVRIDPISFSNWLASEEIALLDCTPSHLKMLMLEPKPLKKIRKVLVGGEAITGELWNKILEIPELEFYNVYGPTECTVDSTIYLITKNSLRPVIGKPIRNTSFICIDKNLNPLPLGVPGELVIKGACVGMGYLNNPELTAEKFYEPNSYRTGDLVRFLENGEVEFLGRIDDQVKIRGFRIELSEIEHWLREVSGIKEARVLAQGEREQEYLHAFLVTLDGQKLEIPAILSMLRENMPEYCLPSKFSLVESIPLNSNGKIDKQKLIQISKEMIIVPDGVACSQFSLPIDTTEVMLLRIWQKIFSRDNFDVNSNFFLLGGQSLMAAQMLNQVRELFKVILPSALFFRKPTIRGIALTIRDFQKSQNIHLEEIREGDVSSIPIFCLHPMGGNTLVYNPIASLSHSANPIYALKSKALHDASDEYVTYEEMCEKYATEIHHFLNGRNCYLVGWSMGGLIAMKVAELLEARNTLVAGIDLWDTGVREEYREIPEKIDLLIRGYSSVLSSIACSIGHEITSSDLTFIREILTSSTDYNSYGIVFIEWIKMNWNFKLHIEPDFVDRIARLSSIHASLFFNYKLPKINADIHAIWSDHSLNNKLLFKNDWQKVTTGNYSEEIITDVTHYTMVAPQNIQKLVSGLESRIVLASLKNKPLLTEKDGLGAG